MDRGRFAEIADLERAPVKPDQTAGTRFRCSPKSFLRQTGSGGPFAVLA